MTKELLLTTHNAERGARSTCREESKTGPSLEASEHQQDCSGFGKSFGEQTWRKQLRETLWRYTEIGEYLKEY